MNRRDEAGQVTVLIIGFAAILMLVVVAAIDSSAAFLQRRGLDNLADGAALYAADLGADGIYDSGVGPGRLAQDERAVRHAVHAYLAQTGAHRRYRGIVVTVSVAQGLQSVSVTLQAPLDLPLAVPGSASAPMIGATGTAAVSVIDP